MTYVCAYQIRFNDGGEPEYGVIHRGTKEECQSTADIIPAISYSGDRPILDCRMAVFEEPASD